MLNFLETLDTAEDKLKFEELYKGYRNRMYHVAWKILQNEQDAEDIVHDSFHVLMKNFEKIDDIYCNKTWNYIVTIVKNKSITLYQSRKKKETLTTEEWTRMKSGVDVAQTVEEKELADALAILMNQLPHPYREVLILQYYNKMSGEEIAKLIGKAPDNVRKISHRAKAMLKVKLLERGIGYEE